MTHPIICVATPCYGGLCTVNYTQSLVRLMSTKPKSTIGFHFMLTTGDSLIPRGRNRLAKRFLDSTATHLLFVDADIQFRPEDVYGLLESGHKLVAAPYPAKELDVGKIIEAAKAGIVNPIRRGTRIVANTRGLESERGENGCIRVHDLPTGFMMIERSVLEDMIKAYPDMEYTDDGGDHDTLYDFFFTGIHEENGTRRYLSEDYGFCRRWQKMGGEAWLYLRSDLGHIGTFLYEHDLEAEITEVTKAEEAAQ